MRNRIYTILAIILISIGIVIFVLPIPMGAFMIAIGLGMLMTYSPEFAKFVKRIRYQNPKFNRFVAKAESRLPAELRMTLEMSNPEKNPDLSILEEIEFSFENGKQRWYQTVINYVAYYWSRIWTFCTYGVRLLKKMTSTPLSWIWKIFSRLIPQKKLPPPFEGIADTPADEQTNQTLSTIEEVSTLSETDNGHPHPNAPINSPSESPNQASN